MKDRGKVIGRIAAFVSRNARIKQGEHISSGLGFFECINDQSAANMLFDAAKEWLIKKGAKYMDGPINFGPGDKWWDLLTKGFELEPNYQCNYNLLCYRELFENYGFQIYFEHYTFVRVISDALHPKLLYKANKIGNDPNYTLEHFRMKEFDRFAEDVIKIYNKAWVNHEDICPISVEQGKALLKRL